MRWQRARAGYLASHPLCRLCEARGHVEPATVVDHVVPHRGDMVAFWRALNWQPLCKACHDGKTLAGDRVAGCNVDGEPLDAAHHWHR